MKQSWVSLISWHRCRGVWTWITTLWQAAASFSLPHALLMISHSSHIRHKAQGLGVSVRVCLCSCIASFLEKLHMLWHHFEIMGEIFLSTLCLFNIIKYSLTNKSQPWWTASRTIWQSSSSTHRWVWVLLKKKEKKCITHYLKIQNLSGSRILNILLFLFPCKLHLTKNCFKILVSNFFLWVSLCISLQVARSAVVTHCLQPMYLLLFSSSGFIYDMTFFSVDVFFVFLQDWNPGFICTFHWQCQLPGDLIHHHKHFMKGVRANENMFSESF